MSGLRRRLAAPFVVAMLAITAAPAFGQAGSETNPVRPIRFVIGGGPDTLARVVGQKLTDIFTWNGVLAPTGTPLAIVAKLQIGIVNALKSTDVQERITSSGFEPLGTTSEDFGAFLKSEVARWTKVVKQSGARID